MKIITSSEFSISTSNKALLYGFSLFETMYVNSKGKIFLINNHIHRIVLSAKQFGFNIQSSTDLMIDNINHYILSENLASIVLRITLLLDEIDPPTLIITTRPYTYSEHFFEKGVNLCISKTFKNNTSNLCYHKTSNYLDHLITLNESKANGYDDALFLNIDNSITETTKSNIFFISDDQVFTPCIESGILPGITRQWVIDLLKSLTIHVYEDCFTLDALLKSDIAFLTNSVFGIVRVDKIGHHVFNNEHSILKILSEKYNSY